MTEVQQLGILDYFTDLLEEEDIADQLTFNVTLSSHISSILQNGRSRGKSLQTSTSLTGFISELSPSEQNEMEYHLLTWLTGSPQSNSEADTEAVVNGEACTFCTLYTHGKFEKIKKVFVGLFGFISLACKYLAVIHVQYVAVTETVNA